MTISNSSIDEPSEVNKPTKESRGMFFKLFNYISGENDKSMHLYLFLIGPINCLLNALDTISTYKFKHKTLLSNKQWRASDCISF